MKPTLRPFCRESVWITDGTSDGTEATTVLQKNSASHAWASMGGALFVRGWDPDYGDEIWKIDGGNQYMIKDVEPGTFGSLPGHFKVVNLDGLGERLFFSATTQLEGFHPWISAGLPGNTELLKVINEFSGHSGTGHFVGFQGLAWFDADDGIAGNELWVSDGTETGNHPIQGFEYRDRQQQSTRLHCGRRPDVLSCDFRELRLPTLGHRRHRRKHPHGL